MWNLEYLCRQQMGSWMKRKDSRVFITLGVETGFGNVCKLEQSPFWLYLVGAYFWILGTLMHMIYFILVQGNKSNDSKLLHLWQQSHMLIQKWLWHKMICCQWGGRCHVWFLPISMSCRHVIHSHITRVTAHVEWCKSSLADINVGQFSYSIFVPGLHPGCFRHTLCWQPQDWWSYWITEGINLK